MNEITEHKNAPEVTEQPLLESKVPEHLVLEHPSYKQLEEKLNQIEQKSQEYWNNWLRTKADLENAQRRAEREIANAHKYALEKFATEMLVIVDNLERSLMAKTDRHEQLKEFYDGIELTLKLFLETLQKSGITQIYPLGEAFNPEQHMAVTTKEDANAKSNVVLEVVQKGYWLKDRLLRPALVVVAK
ncbi:MAG: heat shock protein GrpE [uncultured bacterium]|nr:MAG: heat shock protein GrpE [uncultured bacterium]